jgi:isocitrate lyase
MTAYAYLQTADSASEARGCTATRHPREVGTGYYDAVAEAGRGDGVSTLALTGSTETDPF